MNLKLLAAALLITGGALALLYAAIYELNGHGVPGYLFGAILFGTIALLVGVVMLRSEFGNKL